MAESTKAPAFNLVSVSLLLTAVLVVLKVVGLSTISWFWTLAPAVVAIGFSLVLFVVVFGVIALIAALALAFGLKD